MYITKEIKDWIYDGKYVNKAKDLTICAHKILTSWMLHMITLLSYLNIYMLSRRENIIFSMRVSIR